MNLTTVNPSNVTSNPLGRSPKKKARETPWRMLLQDRLFQIVDQDNSFLRASQSRPSMSLVCTQTRTLTALINYHQLSNCWQLKHMLCQEETVRLSSSCIFRAIRVEICETNTCNCSIFVNISYVLVTIYDMKLIHFCFTDMIEISIPHMRTFSLLGTTLQYATAYKKHVLKYT